MIADEQHQSVGGKTLLRSHTSTLVCTSKTLGTCASRSTACLCFLGGCSDCRSRCAGRCHLAHNNPNSSVLSQGESVKYFLDNLDKLGSSVSCS